jgi:hypothetical protein
MPGAGKYGLEKLSRDFPIVNLLVSQYKKPIGAGRKSALDGKNIAKPQLVGLVNARPCRELRPLAGTAERFKWNLCLALRFLNRACKGKASVVSLRRRGLPEYDYG